MGSTERQDAKTNGSEAFTPMPDWLSRRPGLTWTERFIWARLRRYEQMGEAYPSHATLGREADICPKQAMRCCHSLERKHGLLKIERRRKRGSAKFNTCVYRTLTPSDIDVLRDDRAEGQGCPEPSDMHVPTPKDLDVLNPSDVDVLEKRQENKKQESKTEAEETTAASAATVFRSEEPDKESASVETEELFTKLRRHVPGVARHGKWETEALASGESLAAITAEISEIHFINGKAANPLFMVRDAIGKIANAREALSRQQAIDITAEGKSEAIPPEPVYRNQCIKGKSKCDADCPCGSELFVMAEGPHGPVTLCARCDVAKLTAPIINKCNKLEAQREAGMSWDQIRAISNPVVRGGAGQVLSAFGSDRSR